MRFVIWVGACFLVAACASRDPVVTSPNRATEAGNWKIETQTDRITGQPVSSAFVMAQASNSKIDFPKPAQLQLLCFDKQPLIRFAFDFKIGSDRNSELGYRFDDRPSRANVPSRVLNSYTVVVIEDRAEVARFIDDLRTARMVYVQIRSLNMGRTAAEFRVDSAEAAIKAGFAACPLTQR